MADTAPVTRYRDEFIAAFEYGQSRLRSACVTEAQTEGNQAVFLVAGSGSADAVTRGVDGKIPGRADDLTQNTCTLAEWHDKVIKTRFNIFQSQSNQRRIMQMSTVKVLNRKIDKDIIAQLDTATVDTGSAATASVEMVQKAKAILGVAEVDTSDMDNMFGVVTPAFKAYLEQTTEFSSGDYVEVKPFAGPSKVYWRWAGINWIEHPQLTGVGTSSEKCYLFHRDSIGHAMDTGGMNIAIGYDEEDDYSFARCSGFFGSKKLQNSGIVQMLHDGSAYTGS